MRPARPLLLVLLAASVAFTTGARGDDATVRKAIEANYARWSDAYPRRDLKAIGDMLAPDYTARMLSGRTLDRQQFLQMAQRDLAGMQPGSCRQSIKVTRLTVHGTRAVAEIRDTFSFTSVPNAGRSHRIGGTHLAV